MKDLNEMKGQPRLLMYLVRNDRRIELHVYPDGSYGISRDGDLLGIWEPHEEALCLGAFCKFADFAGVFRKVIDHRPGGGRSGSLN